MEAQPLGPEAAVGKMPRRSPGVASGSVLCKVNGEPIKRLAGLIEEPIKLMGKLSLDCQDGQCTCLLLANELIGALQGQLLLCFGRHAAALQAASCRRRRQELVLWFAVTAAALRALRATAAPAAAWPR